MNGIKFDWNLLAKTDSFNWEDMHETAEVWETSLIKIFPIQ